VLLEAKTKKTACSAHGSRRAVALSKTQVAAAPPSGVQAAMVALQESAAEAMSWLLQAAARQGAMVQACGAGMCKLATAAGVASHHQSMLFSQLMTMSEPWWG
jgi:hypothetical protein